MARRKREIEATLLKDVDVAKGLIKEEVITLELSPLGVHLTTTVGQDTVTVPNDAV